MNNTTKVFTKCNLEIHQLVEESNHKTILELLEKNLTGNAYEKDIVIKFVKRLAANSDKIRYAVTQIEDKLAIGERLAF